MSVENTEDESIVVPAKVEKTEAEKALIAEIQLERQKRREEKEEFERKLEEAKVLQGEDPKKVFADLITLKEQREAEDNKKKALDEFRESVREFSKENDEAGIVFSNFEKEMKKFSFDGLKSEKDYKTRYAEVYEFMNRTKPKQDESVTFYKGGTKDLGTSPKEDNGNILSPQELSTIKDLGWTSERYLKLKASHPDMIAGLFKLQ